MTVALTSSLFARALGADFDRLHPRLRERFGFTSEDGRACVGTGVMDRVWRGPRYTVPFLRLGTTRNVLFPEAGTNVPFTIENYAYRDGFGRETLTFVRTFDLGTGRRRRFDATMVYSPTRHRIVDFLGTHQHVAVDLDLSVDSAGALRIRSRGQRLRVGGLDIRFPRKLSGDADLCEWYDESAGRFRVEVRVTNRLTGPIFGYHGSFVTRYVDCCDAPGSVRPVRENPRA